ncbi:MAG: DUF935 family protein [Patescibacteria group bacterium]|nr:DUF935 family protein [Patescibacteria group bacterium]
MVKTPKNRSRIRNRQDGGLAASVSAPPTTPTSSVVIQPMVAPAPKTGDKLVRGGATAGRPGQIVSAANRWRENYNPLRNLTMRRVVELLELGQRGDYAYLQWAYRFAERRNATLSGLLSRCEAPLAQFDWHIKIIAEPPPGMNEEQFKTKATAQKKTLETAYNTIDNLRNALIHLHTAYFRGYAHVQKHRNPDGDVYHLECLDQWCICRDGINGNWFWNPDSRSTSAPLQFLGPDFCIGGDRLPLEDFIILESERPIDEIGLVDTVRRGLVEKDWDGFIEIYGIPGGVVEMPANVPPGKESEYEDSARKISEGGSGAIPSGSKYYPNSAPRNVDPFTPRIEHLDSALVLAGTGGKLTMMTEHGEGQMRGSSRVHDKTFGEIADGRAQKISERMQRNFDAEVLNTHHEGEPHLVYFHFGAEEQEDLSALCQNVLVLSQAGKSTDTEWLAEKTGYELTDDLDDPNAGGQPPAPGAPGDPDPDEGAPQPAAKQPLPARKVRNRNPNPAELTGMMQDMMLPMIERVRAIEDAQNSGVPAQTIRTMSAKLLADFPHIARVINADNSLARKLSPSLEHTLVNHLQSLKGRPTTYVVRHGETDLNDDGMMRGQLNPPLNPDGQAAARATGDKLAAKDIHMIVSSDLQRAAQTARAIGEKTGAPVKLDRALRPWARGNTIEGHKVKAVLDRVKYFVAHPDERPPGVEPDGSPAESHNEFKHRFLGAYRRIESEHPDKSIAIVTHSSAMRLLGKPDEDPGDFVALPRKKEKQPQTA